MTSWSEARAVIGDERVLLGPQASQQWLRAPDHLAMVLARYRAAAALIGDARDVLEIGCGEGIGARILAAGRHSYLGIDPDAEAIAIADELAGNGMTERMFSTAALETFSARYDAVVALDVLEHLEATAADGWLVELCSRLAVGGVFVLGTPSARFVDLASEASRAGHLTTYTHEHLAALMRRHFRVVQSFGMQDTALHLGHPEARHYLLMCGIGPYA